MIEQTPEMNNRELVERVSALGENSLNDQDQAPRSDYLDKLTAKR